MPIDFIGKETSKSLFLYRVVPDDSLEPEEPQKNPQPEFILIQGLTYLMRIVVDQDGNIKIAERYNDCDEAEVVPWAAKTIEGCLSQGPKVV